MSADARPGGLLHRRQELREQKRRQLEHQGRDDINRNVPSAEYEAEPQGSFAEATSQRHPSGRFQPPEQQSGVGFASGALLNSRATQRSAVLQSVRVTSNLYVMLLHFIVCCTPSVCDQDALESFLSISRLPRVSLEAPTSVSHAIELLRDLVSICFVDFVSVGNVAVDGFFLISGYLGARSFLHTWRRQERRRSSGRESTRMNFPRLSALAEFYANRLCRLLPSLWVVLSLVFVMKRLSAPTSSPLDEGSQGLGLPDKHLQSDSADGDSLTSLLADGMLLTNILPSSKQFFQLCWSLAVDTQCYVLLPGIVAIDRYLLGRNINAARTRSKSTEKAEKLLDDFQGAVHRQHQLLRWLMLFVASALSIACQYQRALDAPYSVPSSHFTERERVKGAEDALLVAVDDSSRAHSDLLTPEGIREQVALSAAFLDSGYSTTIIRCVPFIAGILLYLEVSDREAEGSTSASFSSPTSKGSGDRKEVWDGVPVSSCWQFLLLPGSLLYAMVGKRTLHPLVCTTLTAKDPLSPPAMTEGNSLIGFALSAFCGLDTRVKLAVHLSTVHIVYSFALYLWLRQLFLQPFNLDGRRTPRMTPGTDKVADHTRDVGSQREGGGGAARGGSVTVTEVLGPLSYCSYLVHIVIFMAICQLLQTLATAWSFITSAPPTAAPYHAVNWTPSVPLLLFAFIPFSCTSYGVAWVLHKYIEIPCEAHRRRFFRQKS